MAHYLAISGSRYRYSHDHEFLPIRSLSRILKDESCSMYLSRVSKDKQVPFCRALNYLYRPTAFEHYCPYKFFQTISVVKNCEINKRETFDFTDAHPKGAITKCVYREHDCIPNLDWTFFNNSNILQQPLFKNPRNRTGMNNRYCDVDEEHARKYLLGFSAFRDENDLKIYSSYKKRIQRGFENGEFDEYFTIMQNIQNIRNSLDAGRMNNDIPTIEIEDHAAEDMERDDDEDIDDFRNIIATYFASTSNHKILDREPDDFEFKKADFVNSGADEGDIWKNPPEKVYKYTTAKQTNGQKTEQTARQFCSISGMNSLLKKAFIMKPGENGGTASTISPNGTVESIIAYGLSRKFDLDQQTAFEILTATLVLTYVEDVYLSNKPSNESDPDTSFVFLEKKRSELRSLAQIEERENRPLRMFLTGAAGAGKCK